MLNIYKHSHFQPDSFGHGGSKRTAQIEQLLAQSGIEIKQADLTYAIATTNKLSLYLGGLSKNMTLRTDSKTKYAIGRYKVIFEHFVKQYKPSLFIWESVIEYNLMLAEILFKHNIPIVALPHNLESLVAGKKSVFSNKPSPQWLLEELNYLKLCKKVFTISREEHWLLSTYGIDASYLPYYPARDAELFLLNIRQKRTAITNKHQSEEQNVLLLGTFHNQATFTGFTALLQHLKTVKNLKINVVGYGSEKLIDELTATNIHVWGAVSTDILANLIIGSDCAVIYQQPSSGALTRIPELLIAGLPVIANTHAARSCDKIQGLEVYDTFEELTQILSSATHVIPPIISKPKEEQNFINYFKYINL